MLLFLVTLLAAVSPGAAAMATAPDPVDDVPVATANPFLPENEDLTTCVGMLERPGCGSEARGGLHQNLVAIAMMSGLVIVFGRVAWGVRRHRHDADVDVT